MNNCNENLHNYIHIRRIHSEMSGVPLLRPEIIYRGPVAMTALNLQRINAPSRWGQEQIILQRNKSSDEVPITIEAQEQTVLSIHSHTVDV